MRGTLFMLTAICISTAFGCPAPSRATAIPTTCLMNVSVTARKKEGLGYASFQRKRVAMSYTIQANVLSTGSMYLSLKPSPKKRVFRS